MWPKHVVRLGSVLLAAMTLGPAGICNGRARFADFRFANTARAVLIFVPSNPLTNIDS